MTEKVIPFRKAIVENEVDLAFDAWCKSTQKIVECWDEMVEIDNNGDLVESVSKSLAINELNALSISLWHKYILAQHKLYDLEDAKDGDDQKGD
jgi:hypothetical protein